MACKRPNKDRNTSKGDWKEIVILIFFYKFCALIVKENSLEIQNKDDYVLQNRKTLTSSKALHFDDGSAKITR